MSWQPNEEGIKQVLTMLKDSTSPDSAVQKQVTMELERLRCHPDFLGCLAHILVYCQQEDTGHRSVAGLLLKNGITQSAEALPSMQYIKAAMLQGLAEPVDIIRHTAGTVISTILGMEETGSWNEALSALANGMASQDEKVVDGVFNTLQKIVEDCPHRLQVVFGGVNFIDQLVPQFIAFTGYQDVKVRMYALDSLQSLWHAGTPGLVANVDGYVKALFARASDTTHPDTIRAVCLALGSILSVRPDTLENDMQSVVDFIAYCTTFEDEIVALEACEFWLTFAEDPTLVNTLRKYLPKVVPLLLQNMVYSELDLMYLDNDEEDEAVPDREEDIKPRNYGGKAHGVHESNEDQGNQTASKSRNVVEDDDDDDEDDYDDDDDDDDGASEWNRRKCAAAALDVLAVSFRQDLLVHLLELLKERLFSDDWKERESGILALGAIAEGCLEALEPHLPQLIPYLISALEDPKALVRSITCWTLGRYSSWVVAVSSQDKETFFLPTMNSLLQKVLDGNKRVQEAGCSAFATLEEEAGGELAPFLEPILRNLMYAFSKYQQKNLLIMYDAIGTLADSVMGALGQPEYMEILMPPLIEKWQSLSDTDSDLVPLLECLSSVTLASGKAFAPYAVHIYQRCIKIIGQSLMQWQMFQANPDHVEEPDRTFIVVALDLLSGLAQGLGGEMVQLIERSSQEAAAAGTTQPSVIDIVKFCLKHPEPPVRQSAHALLGDMAMTCFSLLYPEVEQLMPSIIEQITPEPTADCVSVCNNAVWAAGEIAMQFGPDPTKLVPFVDDLLKRLVPILLNSKSPKSLSENAAVTIGRLGLVCPEQIAPHLAVFAHAWCTALWDIKDNDEKDSAFRGFCRLIMANPSGIEQAFVHFCNAICKWQQPSRELDGMFRSLLQEFKTQSGAGWEPTVNAFPPMIRQRLAERYQV